MAKDVKEIRKSPHKNVKQLLRTTNRADIMNGVQFVKYEQGNLYGVSIMVIANDEKTKEKHKQAYV